LEKLETEHKKLKEALREGELEMSALFKYSPALLIVVDKERRVRKVNNIAVDFARRSAKEMIGLHGGEALRCLHFLDDPRGCGFGTFCKQCKVRLTILDTFETGKSHHKVEASLPFIRGEQQEELSLFVSTVPLSVLGKERVIVCIEDITERKQAEEEKERLQAQLVQSEKMAGIGTLTSGIAHEFNNLLQIMSGHTEYATSTKKPEDMEEALEIVGNTSDRVSKIVKDLLTFSSKEALERKRCTWIYPKAFQARGHIGILEIRSSDINKMIALLSFLSRG
jgi:C4-dicarboxylate-specific signal transduction histidine kinase